MGTLIQWSGSTLFNGIRIRIFNTDLDSDPNASLFRKLTYKAEELTCFRSYICGDKFLLFVLRCEQPTSRSVPVFRFWAGSGWNEYGSAILVYYKIIHFITLFATFLARLLPVLVPVAPPGPSHPPWRGWRRWTGWCCGSSHNRSLAPAALYNTGESLYKPSYHQTIQPLIIAIPEQLINKKFFKWTVV